MERFVLMVVIAILVLAACGVVAEAFTWGLRHGTVTQSEQERYDHRFERITRRPINRPERRGSRSASNR